MHKNDYKYSIVWPINQPPKCIGPAILQNSNRISVKVYINKSSTSEEQRNKFDNDLMRIARSDLVNK